MKDDRSVEALGRGLRKKGRSAVGKKDGPWCMNALGERKSAAGPKNQFPGVSAGYAVQNISGHSSDHRSANPAAERQERVIES